MRRALVAIVLFLCSCSGTSVKFFDNTIIDGRKQPPRESVRPIVWGGGLPLKSFDPNGEAGWCEVTSLLHARLFTADSQGQLSRDLAEDAHAANGGRTWSVTLRTDARWHDGAAVTANDVLATWKALANDGSSETRRNLTDVAGVVSVEAKGSTVRFNLSHPFPELPDILTEMAVLPAHVIESGPGAIEEHPIGAGPFKFLGRAGNTFTMAPHAAWHGGAVRPPSLLVKIIEDDRERGRALARGVIDAAHVKPESLSLFGDAERFRIHRAPSGVIRAIPLDTRSPGLGDARVRRALGALIDRVALIEAALGGFGRPAWQLLAPNNPGFVPSLDHASMTRDEAGALLDKAGWTVGEDGLRRNGGRTLRVRLVAWQGEAFRRKAGAFVVKAWRAAGVDATVVPVDHAGYTALARDLRGRAEGFVGGWGSLRMPVTVLARKVGTGGAQNRGGFSHPPIDEALRSAAATVPAAERVARVREIQRTLDQQVPWIPLAYPDYLFAVRAKIEGVTFGVVDSWYEWPRHLWRARWKPKPGSQRR
ncbi:MAG: ABC transporter substrate-binding protein [Planctomycetes bacterium]|nr:ABC transporter substrate-binding protein [Planctomycetota bacterium]